jgi:gliding motility-associated-like protein
MSRSPYDTFVRLVGTFSLLASLTVPAQGQVFLAADGVVYETCSGTFFDTGGAAGNYGNDQNIVTTICPTGGSGAGPDTEVRFTAWALAVAQGDTLWVYDGVNTSGPVLAVGHNALSLLNTTVTASGPSGCLTFEWKSNATGVAAGWAAAIRTGPDAGADGTITTCANGQAFSLFSSLGGTPDLGGTWTAPGGAAHSGTFIPGTDVAGIYTYTVSSPAPCAPDAATVTVSVVAPPNPGTNGTLVRCSNSPPASLFAALGGTPQVGGTWVGPGGPHGASFNPATDPPGVYTYTVNGTAPCGPASASVTVTVNPFLSAGSNGTITVCDDDAAVNLFSALGGTPAAGGTWTGPGGAASTGVFTPGASTPGNYTYSVQGLAPCAISTATVTVTQVAAPDAGGDRTIVVCSDDAPFALISRLNGSPDAGGTWVGPGGPHGATFDPAVDLPGAYVYTVNGTAPCDNASATLTIQVREAPDAGTNGSITVCSIDASFALISELGGTPDAGGSWTGPGGTSTGTFIPGSSPAGVYTYTVTGQSPCDPATATVTVTVNVAPNAGTNATVTRCSNAPAFSLFAQLGGTPDAGGTWTGPGGVSNGTFTPGTSLPGAYTYQVLGQAPCANATAVVNVVIVPAPVAGSNGSITVCSNDAPFQLISVLGGSPAGNGTWTGPGGVSNGTFTPGTSLAGVYTYTVPGTAPCANAQATVTVGVVQAPNAGGNGSITVCSSDGAVNLFSLLTGTPSAGGTWTGPGGGAHSGTYLPGTQPGGNYTYRVAGTGPCDDATAVVQVVRVLAVNAGTDGTITVCSTNAPFQLVNVLGASPNSGGTWTGPGGPSNGTFTPGTSVAGQYRYVVPGTAPCPNDTSFVTVQVNIAPNAGTNATTTVCDSQAPFNLITVLGGTPNAGGTWTRPNGTASTGVFTPVSSEPGGYTYTVAGITPCLNASAVVVVNVNEQPEAGDDENITRCSTSGPIDLFDELDDAEPGGQWTGPSGASSGIFVPGTSTPGQYRYVLLAQPPCINDTAFVQVTINVAPNAGADGTITICQGTATVDLFDGLGGTPDLNGTWVDQDGTGQLSGSLLNAIGLPPGSYDFEYEVPANGPCAADEAEVTVVVVPQLDAGSNGTLTACATNTQVNLFNGLGGSPQQGGQWIDLGSTGALNGQFVNATVLTPGTYTFRYRLLGILGCDSDSAQVNLTVVGAPNAGTNGSTSVCSTGDPVSLFQFLGGSPSPGGVWRRGSPNGPVFSGGYNPAVDNSGFFFYIVSGTAPCANAVASVQVTEVPGANPGQSRSIAICSNSAPFNMTTQLGGTPNPAGQWFFNGQPRTNIFTPGLDVQGIYEYRVTGQFPCPIATATLTISVEPEADAGGNGSRTVCSDAGEFLLFSVLGGSPQFGGSWIDEDGQSHDGSFTPGTDEPGEYRYVVIGTAPCTNDTATVSIFVNEAADAGLSSSVAFCSTAGPVDLFTALLGTPDAGGTWVGPAPGNPPFSGNFVPGVSATGVYTYRVAGIPPCTERTATVTVAVTTAASAGGSNSITVCSSDPAFAMVNRLLGTPALNGTWRGPLPSTAVMSGIFFPGTTTPGTYRYTIPADGACPVTSVTLTIGVNPQPNAGVDASITLCETSGAVNLFTLLGPTAQIGGTWRRASNGQVHSGTIVPATDESDTYIYRVTGVPPCGFDEASVQVTINASPEAGCNGLITMCDDQLPVNLFSLLTCSPQSPGIWLDPDLALHSGVFIPGDDEPGVYSYVVAGSAPCSNDTALVTVIVNDAPDAGTNNAILICSDEPNIQLIGRLGGTPDAGGVWTDPNGAPFSGTYDPGVSEPGTYWYRISGDAPCVSDSASVTVVENVALSAGTNSVAAFCTSDAAVPLITLLGGSPDNGGSWTRNGDAVSPFFNPAVDPAGTYVYTIAGLPPCTVRTAQVTISVSPAVSAGSDGAITACVDASAIDLAPALGGTVTPGGTWVNQSNVGVLNGATWDATGVLPGVYGFTYTVIGLGACEPDNALVNVTITPALNAGIDVATTACSGELLVLFNSLAGAPQPGGVWQDLNGSGALVGGGVFNTGAVPAGTTWNFRYILSASSLCEADSALVTVTVLDGPNAGCDGSINLCSNAVALPLATGLNCTPDAGGAWFTAGGVPHGATFDPATDVPGDYAYVVPAVGDCPADTAFVTVNVVQAPNAGTNTSVAICSSDPGLNLFTLLGPEAQAGGSWIFVTGGNIPTSPIYTPAVNSPGVYQYTVQGQGPCANAVALVEVTEPAAPNAGCDASVTLCSSQAPVLMRSILGCSPQAGGTWIGPSGPHGNFFDTADDEPGVYTYVVTGVTPCANDSARLTLSVTQANNAGENATVDACASQTAVDLFAALGPNADTGGTWTDQNGSGALVGNVFNPSQAGNGTWVFAYGFPANGPCPAASAQVIVNVGSGVSAGTNAQVTVCGAACAFDLFEALGGTPTTGGTWTDQLGTGALTGGTLNACQLPAGTIAPFVYTVTDVNCGDVQATVLVTVSDFPDPGGDVALVLCSTDGPLDLFAQLVGTPDNGGIWIAPDGNASTGAFVPGASLPGDYIYQVTGNASCPDTTATITIAVNLPPDPGTNGTLSACDTLVALDLIAGLQGTPQPGGQWTDVSGSGGLQAGLLNTTFTGAGTFTYRYEVNVPSCGTASALVELVVHGSVETSEPVRLCNTVDRTYTVSFTLTGGDASSYAVTGTEGTLVDGAFTSAPIPTSAAFEAFAQDAFACSLIRIVATSPCTFEDDVFVPQSFTPNGDGANDRFIIPGIEGYPANTITIFNRWGGKVFEGAGYNNTTVVWDGASPDAALSGVAPTGTYFYVLDLGNDKEALTGYIYLNR